MTTTLWCTIQGKCSCSSVQNVFFFFFYQSLLLFLYVCGFRKAFSRNKKATMIPIPDRNVVIGEARSMSRNDILRINRLYCSTLRVYCHLHLWFSAETTMNLHTVPGCFMLVSRWAAIPLLFTSNTYLV